MCVVFVIHKKKNMKKKIVTTKDELKELQSDLNDILSGNIDLFIAKHYVL